MQTYTVTAAEQQIEDWVRAGLASGWGEDTLATSVVVRAKIQFFDHPTDRHVRIQALAFGDVPQHACVDLLVTERFHRTVFTEAGEKIASALRQALGAKKGN